MCKANAVFLRSSERFSGELTRLGWRNGRRTVRLWAFSVAMAGLVTSGCGSPVATLNISAPSTAVSGSPFTITITAMLNGSQDKIFNDEIHVTSSDPAAVLPSDYQYTAADAGSHTFPNGVTLRTPGRQTINVGITTSAGITGSTTVTVSAANVAAQF
ncbi:MAG TPA: hypothetical protein VGK96_15935 [Candidatus Sulfotelmatobacter sp.]